MKPWLLRRGSLLAVLAILIVALSGCASTRQAAHTPAPPATSGEQALASSGDQLSLEPGDVLPVDPAIKVGGLPNGLRYFIRTNSEPEERAELWLAVNAGSMQEDTDQLGLAHFVEHMAFNGTRHFEKQEMVDFFETIGMRFGPDVNAYTSFDETVYTLRIPTDDDDIVKKAFLVLEDWSRAVLFEDEEIDKERGVVLEEWRRGRGAEARMRDEQFPVLFQGSRYAERLPIGEPEIIETAPHDAVRRFYRDWYRPGLMAVIAVGDFDAERIEASIRKHFAKPSDPEAPRSREIYPVPDHDGTLWAIATDPEATSTRVAVYQKLEKRPDETVEDYRRSLVESLYHSMLNARLDEIRQQPDPPFLASFSSSGGFVRSKDVYQQYASVKDDGVSRGLDALLVEVERADRHGFTQSELDRTKKNLLRRYEQAYRERDKRRSSSLAREILRFFLAGEPMPGIEVELDLTQKLLPSIALDEVNHLSRQWIGEDNRVILVNAPEKEGVPTPSREELLPVLTAALAKEIEPYVDRVRDEPLVAEPPRPGEVVEEKQIDEIGVTEWTLANGVRVMMKPTDFKNDEILLSGFSPGGHSLVSDEEHISAAFSSSVLGAGGVGGFSRVELQKALAGKVARASASIGELEERVSASASPEDLETMFELLYLRMTAPRKDEEAFQAWLDRSRAAIENRSSRPETVFNDRFNVILSQEHPRRRPMSVELLDELDLDRALAIHRQRFGKTGDFTFVLVGNFQPEEIRPLVLTYLGGLPSGGGESWRDVGVRPPSEVVEFEVEKGLEPKSQVRILFTGETEWSRQSSHDMTSLGSALRIRLREVLREDMGGVYGVGAGGSISRRPTERYSFSISFGCSPDNVEKLTQAVFNEIEHFKEQPIDESYVTKVKEIQRRERETGLRENRFWLYRLAGYYSYGDDPRLILDYDELVDNVSAESIQASANRYLDSERYVMGKLYPESGAPSTD